MRRSIETLDYSKCAELLSKRPRRKMTHNTYLERAGEDFVVMLYDTVILRFLPDGDCVLSSGGWRTVTTKDRLNRYGPAYVSQRDYVWYVNGERFQDGMTINVQAIRAAVALADAVNTTGMEVDWRPSEVMPEDYYA